MRVAVPQAHSTKSEYNARSMRWYLEALEAVRAEPVVIATEESPSAVAQIAATCQGVLLPGSPADVDPEKYGAERDPKSAEADPGRDNVDELLLQDAFNLYKPVFAICYGVQILNVWRTGTLIQHLPQKPVNHEVGSKVERAHRIEIVPGTKLAEIAGAKEEWVNSSHHQALGAVGDGLRVSATCPEDGVIEAVEGTNPEHWVVGVQWHPERSYASEELSKKLFAEFAMQVKAWRPRTVLESVVR